MISAHLGRRITDLLDGRMTPEQTYAAMAHLGECAQCSERWHELRAAREALNSSEVGLDMRFAQKLLDKDRMASMAAAEPAHHVRAAKGRSTTPVVAASAVLALVASTLGVAYAAGAPERVGLEFAGPVSSTSAQTVAYHGPDNMRSGDQLRSWIHPQWSDGVLVPVEAKVVRGGHGARVLVASVVAHMHPVIITEQHGQLSGSTKRDLDEYLIEDLTVYVASQDPPQLVWETGEVVISASCDCPLDVLESVAAAFPVDAEPGFVDRVSAGLSEMADAVFGD